MDFFAFDNLISDDNYVRVIDAFVDYLNLKDLGLITYLGDNRGQKPYYTEILLKIHIYYFFNGIQSSRKQEHECTRNIELIKQRKVYYTALKKNDKILALIVLSLINVIRGHLGNPLFSLPII